MRKKITPPRKQVYRVLGLMSGTSLDGVDLALCTFEFHRNKWSWAIERAKTVPYNKEWRSTLSGAHLLSGEALIALHTRYGRWLSTQCRAFIKTSPLPPDLIASHGHTIFHQPGNGFTFQLGDGAAIHSACGVPLAFDFRQLDVQLGGQGAPLVPIGDRHLFHQVDVCMNLGGIANLSFEKKGSRVAWDICYTNMGLNLLAEESGLRYDRDGVLARSGKPDKQLLKDLEQAGRMIGRGHPSLGREQFERLFQPLLINKTCPLAGRLHTMTEYIARRTAAAIKNSGGRTVLLTGGGAHNRFLVERMQHHCGSAISIAVADRMITDFKEALIFAFLGVLRLTGQNNALASVTGAQRDNCSGTLVGITGSGT
ncbi:MAG: anhydro-N-acetylmuramic acid kinase [Bacteroidota bacterium]